MRKSPKCMNKSLQGQGATTSCGMGRGLIFMTTSDMGCRQGGLLWVNHVWEVGGASMPEPRVLENPKLMGWVMSY